MGSFWQRLHKEALNFVVSRLFARLRMKDHLVDIFCTALREGVWWFRGVAGLKCGRKWGIFVMMLWSLVAIGIAFSGWGCSLFSPSKT